MAKTPPASPTSSGMTRQELNDLSKLINERFKVLQQDLDTRRDQVQRAVRDRMIREAKDRCREARERLEPLVREARELKARIETEVKSIGGDLDVFPGEYHEREEWLDSRGRRKRTTISSYERDPVNFTVNNSWAPQDLEAAIAQELEQLGDLGTNGGRSLDNLRIDLQEELITTGLNGDAKAFLGKIPKLDSLLPPPSQVRRRKTLTSGS